MARTAIKWRIGIHKDKDIEDIPNQYLEYIVLQNWFEKKYPDLLKAAESEIEYRKKFDINIT